MSDGSFCQQLARVGIRGVAAIILTGTNAKKVAAKKVAAEAQRAPSRASVSEAWYGQEEERGLQM